MFINNNMKNNFFNPNKVINENKEDMKTQENTNKKSISVNKDSISISKRGKDNNVLLSLMKQKEEIIRQKNELLAKTGENGQSKEVIDERVKGLNELLSYIEKQISERREAEEIAKKKSSEKENYPKPRTKEEAESRRLHSVVSLGSRLKDGKVQMAVKERIDGEKNVIESEIKLDKGRGQESQFKSDYLEKLDMRSENLGVEINETLDDVNKHIRFANEMTKVEKELDKKENREKEERKEKSERLKKKD